MVCDFYFYFWMVWGLGSADEATNPFARAEMPHLWALLGGRALTLAALDGKPVLETERATLLALDAGLGVEGLPQSATGQAVLLTGQNIPVDIGYHYGPKPNPAVAAYLRNGNLFNTLRKQGRRATLINAYPPRYFEAIQSGRRIFSSIPLAVTSAGIPLMTSDDLNAGRALSADFTSVDGLSSSVCRERRCSAPGRQAGNWQSCVRDLT